MKQSRTEASNRGLVYIKPPEPKIIPQLFRGDDRMPGRTLPDGFAARGTNMSLRDHVIADFKPYHPQSGYVSTTSDPSIAKTFPKHATGTLTETWMYHIQPPNSAVDVCEVLPSQLTDPRDVREFDGLQCEKEFAIPKRIESRDIKGVTRIEIELMEGGDAYDPLDYFHNEKEFISNPDFRRRILAKDIFHHPLYRGLHRTAQAVTGVFVAVDTVSIYRAYTHSHRTGNWDYAINETARVAGGWAMGATYGAMLGKLGFSACTPFGPFAQVGCGFVGGVAGGVGGYIAGSIGAPHAVYQARSELGHRPSITYDEANLFQAGAFNDVVVRPAMNLAQAAGEYVGHFPDEPAGRDPLDDVPLDRDWTDDFIPDAPDVLAEPPPEPDVIELGVEDRLVPVNPLADPFREGALAFDVRNVLAGMAAAEIYMNPAQRRLALADNLAQNALQEMMLQPRAVAAAQEQLRLIMAAEPVAVQRARRVQAFFAQARQQGMFQAFGQAVDAAAAREVDAIRPGPFAVLARPAEHRIVPAQNALVLGAPPALALAHRRAGEALERVDGRLVLAGAHLEEARHLAIEADQNRANRAARQQALVNHDAMAHRRRANHAMNWSGQRSYDRGDHTFRSSGFGSREERRGYSAAWSNNNPGGRGGGSFTVSCSIL